jgi:hypothetical protein
LLPNDEEVRVYAVRKLTVGEFIGRWATYISGGAIGLYGLKLAGDLIAAGLDWKSNVLGGIVALVGVSLSWILVEAVAPKFGDFY